MRAASGHEMIEPATGLVRPVPGKNPPIDLQNLPVHQVQLQDGRF
jgi:hypothetical protein